MSSGGWWPRTALVEKSYMNPRMMAAASIQKPPASANQLPIFIFFCLSSIERWARDAGGFSGTLNVRSRKKATKDVTAPNMQMACEKLMCMAGSICGDILSNARGSRGGFNEGGESSEGERLN